MSEQRAEDGWTEAWGSGSAPRDSGGPPVPPSLPVRFRPERLIGSGGQADVWLAHDAELDEMVAVKVFRPGLDEVARERLRREVRLGRTLGHGRLVRMYELIDAGDRLAVTMEWVPGGTVAERLRSGPLPVGEAVRVAGEVLDALSYLHGQGVVHRDVKPSNILFDAAGGARLADFGLARPLGEAYDLTRTALSVGTPGYMSPEQIRGEAPLPATDLYGLGATLFEMLAGRPPFVGASAFDVARQHVSDAPPDLAALRGECPRWLARFALRLLEKRPSDRFASADEARRALGDEDVPGSPRLRRRRARAAVAAVAAAALALVAWKPVARLVSPAQSVKTVVEGSTVRGVGAGGETVWSRTFSGPPVQLLTTDLEGDGWPEAVVVTPPPDEKGDERPAEILVLDARGRRVSSVEPGAILTDWPFEYARAVSASVSAVDLTGDERPELVMRFRHKHYFPSGLAVFWPGPGTWEVVLYHSGWIGDVLPVPGALGRLRFTGVNNRMGFLAVEGELEVRPPGLVPGPPGSRTAQVVPGGQLGGTRGTRLTRYVLGGEVNPGEGRLEVLAGGGSRTVLASGTFEVDALGNPVPGPNEGRDLMARRISFVARTNALFGTGMPTSPAGVEVVLSEIRAEVGPLLEEMPYRAVLGLVDAKARALAGNAEGAIAGLRRTFREAPLEDVEYRLAHLEALGGNLVEARSLLERPGLGARTGRWGFDAPLLLLRVLIEAGEREAYREALLRPLSGFWGAFPGPSAGDRFTSLMARAHLLWDEAGEEDAAVRSWGYVPEADALAALARWRLGRTEPGDPDRMRRLAVEWPDAASEARLAVGASLLGQGRSGEAVSELDALAVSLDVLARDDYAHRQTLDLARTIRLKALVAAGRGAEAAREGRALRGSLRPGLLPRILVEEVLRDAESGQPGARPATGGRAGPLSSPP